MNWQSSLTAIAPLFLWIGCGFLVGRLGLLNKTHQLWFRQFVFRFGMPLFVGFTMLKAQTTSHINFGYYLGHFSGVFIALAMVTCISHRFFEHRSPNHVIFGFSSSQANIVLIGLALVNFTLGEKAALPVALLLAVNLPVNLTVMSLLIHGEGSIKSFSSVLRVIGRSLLKSIQEPVILAIILGMSLNGLGFAPSQPFLAAIEGFSSLIIPLSLILIGLTIGQSGFAYDKEIITYTLVKLVIQPLVVFIVGRYVVGLDDLWLQVGVIFAAAPTGINAIMFAANHGTVYEKVCQLFGFSTTVSLLSYTVWFSIIGI